MESYNNHQRNHGRACGQSRIGPVQDWIDPGFSLRVKAPAEVVDDAEEQVGDAEAERVDDVVVAPGRAVDEQVHEGVERRERVKMDVSVRDGNCRKGRACARISAGSFDTLSNRFSNNLN